MYDGATGAAEAVLMALRIRPKARRVLVARSLHPQYREVIVTYLQGVGDIDLVDVPFRDDGRIDANWLQAHIDENVAAVIVGYPNFFGIVEDLVQVRAAVAAPTLLITATPEPLALALVKAPGTLGADIAIGEGQSFGIGMSYGGPGVGLFATRAQFVRSMPGRLVGEAVDGAGRRGYVLTLATREQHIRRERATSNICTNHGLMALAVTVYLSLLGQQGLRQLARVNLERAPDFCKRLTAGSRWKARFTGPFFNELAISGKGAPAALARADKAGVLAGVALGRWYPELDDTILIAVTEVHDTAAMNRLVEVLA
jgi:glycine dehydrogenase subunit 1